jgi:hypothetical protein
MSGRSRRDTESRYRLGATPFYATLTAGQQYQSANVQYVRVRGPACRYGRIVRAEY